MLFLQWLILIRKSKVHALNVIELVPIYVYWYSKQNILDVAFSKSKNFYVGREVRVSADARKKASYAEELRKQMEEDKRNRQRYITQGLQYNSPKQVVTSTWVFWTIFWNISYIQYTNAYFKIGFRERQEEMQGNPMFEGSGPSARPSIRVQNNNIPQPISWQQPPPPVPAPSPRPYNDYSR